jgi:hypothetical protein
LGNIITNIASVVLTTFRKNAEVCFGRKLLGKKTNRRSFEDYRMTEHFLFNTCMRTYLGNRLERESKHKPL